MNMNSPHKRQICDRGPNQVSNKDKTKNFNKTEGLFSFTFQKMRTVCKQQTSTKLHKTDRLISVMINISASRKHLCTSI